MPNFNVLLLQSKQLYSCSWFIPSSIFYRILFLKSECQIKSFYFQSSISFLKVGKLGKKKTKVKVWKDVDEVIKATIEIPKKVQWLIEVMEEVPRGEKSNFQASFFYYNHYQSI